MSPRAVRFAPPGLPLIRRARTIAPTLREHDRTAQRIRPPKPRPASPLWRPLDWNPTAAAADRPSRANGPQYGSCAHRSAGGRGQPACVGLQDKPR
eukprot:gene16520-biopygen9764